MRENVYNTSGNRLIDEIKSLMYALINAILCNLMLQLIIFSGFEQDNEAARFSIDSTDCAFQVGGTSS